jgi:methionyl-tRNA formyltransferase
VTRLVFAGTPDFAAIILRGLMDAGHDIALVLTQPDRPAGRGMRVSESPVKIAARTAGIPVFQPVTLKSPEAVSHLRETASACMIVAAYGLILPPAVLDLFPRRCINVHGSLLPRWRGAAPVQRAILEGDAITGVCIMQMEAGLDTGPVYATTPVPVGADDNAESLLKKLADVGANTLTTCLPSIVDNRCPALTQAEAGVTYAAKISKTEAIIDWQQDAQYLDRMVRAFYGFPVAQTTLRREAVRIWRARPESHSGPGRPGKICHVDKTGILVVCGRNAIRLQELQRPGGRRLPAEEFARGLKVQLGERFSVD